VAAADEGEGKSQIKASGRRAASNGKENENGSSCILAWRSRKLGIGVHGWSPGTVMRTVIGEVSQAFLAIPMWSEAT
jgi:hypothetical protein